MIRSRRVIMNMQRLGLLSLVLLATSACRANYVAAPPEVENEEDLVGASSSSATKARAGERASVLPLARFRMGGGAALHMECWVAEATELMLMATGLSKEKSSVC